MANVLSAAGHITFIFLLHPNVVRYFYSIFTNFCFAEQNVKCNFYYYLCNRIGKGDMIPNVDILSDAGHITFIFLLHPNVVRYFYSIFTNFCFAEQNVKCNFYYYLCNRIGKGDMIPNVDILSDAGHITFIF